MQFVAGDFETYYAKGYKLNAMPTEEYIRDPRFELLIYTQKVNGGDTTADVGHDAICRHIMSIDWDNSTFIAHNARFDAMILSLVFGVRPKRIVCTQSMARAVGLGSVGSVGLEELSRRLIKLGYPIKPKGKEVHNAFGKRLADFTPAELNSYIEYGITDTDNLWALFNALLPLLPADELVWQDAILHGSSAPLIRIDAAIVQEEIARLDALKAEIFGRVAAALAIPVDDLPPMLRSKDKFRLVLESMGGAISQEAFNDGAIGRSEFRNYGDYLAHRPGNPGLAVAFNIPLKISAAKSKTAGYNVYELAVSKSDTEFADWIDGDDDALSVIAQARFAAQSSIAMSRAQRFLSLSKYPGNTVPINISGANQTHRMSGADKLNIQNLPSGRKEGQSKALRSSIMALAGRLHAVGDASQIEARVLCYVAGQVDTLAEFGSGGDPYSVMGAICRGLDADWVKANRKNDPVAKRARDHGKVAELQCGYQSGGPTLQQTAKAQHKVELTLDEAVDIVKMYRTNKPYVVNFWKLCEQVLLEMIAGRNGTFGGPNNDLFFYDGNRMLMGERVPGILGPDGLWLSYPKLRLEDRELFGRTQPRPICTRARGSGYEQSHLYGGKLTENLIQYLAFATGKWQSRQLAKHYPLVMNEHDAWIISVPEGEGPLGAELVRAALKYQPPWLRASWSHGPDWLQGCPLASEVGWGTHLGEIKKS